MNQKQRLTMGQVSKGQKTEAKTVGGVDKTLF
jgi:hypothetical protein